MKLFPATPADVLDMIAVGRLAHGASRYNRFPYDELKLLAGLTALIAMQESRGSHLCLLAESGDGRLIGMFIGSMEEYFFTHSKSANSVLLWVDPDFRGSAAALRLIRAFCTWAGKRGAVEVTIPIESGVRMAKSDRFLRRLGFVQKGGNYSIPLRTACSLESVSSGRPIDSPARPSCQS
ncbi:GNAT family N-acetyltransferase [Sulfuritalea sp.]|uniref:GNAT family N-acetyltransferase n=1 Tax=Sulfuritalea sp. TaxID=2480090 RepID=UPI00286E0B99|nr:GNAT family N-acetyltransferase [Sulfuritalea sp.]